MVKKYHVQERSFLNLKPEMRAYVIAVVEDTRDTHPCCEEYRFGGEVVFELASCYDEINLHFDMTTDAERANSLHKARRLAEIVMRSVTLSRRRSKRSMSGRPFSSTRERRRPSTKHYLG